MAETGGPLQGMRIIEFAGIGPAPFAAMVLAGMGADVIRIERPARESTEEQLRQGSRVDILGRGRRSIALDLKCSDGLRVAKQLVSASEGLIEGFRPKVMERLGLGPEVALELNPKITYVRMTGWGQSGPMAHVAGHDLNFIALTGILNAIGPKDEPSVPLNVVGDFGGGGAFAVIGMLAGILNSRATGHGAVVDAAIVDGVSLFSSMFRGLLDVGQWVDRRSENLLDGGCPFYSLYKCKDGRYISVGALEPKFYLQFLQKLDLDGDSRFADQFERNNWAEMRGVLAKTFASKDALFFKDLFYGSDCCVAVVNDFNDAVADPHLVARESFKKIDGIVHPAPAPRFEGYSPSITKAPLPGEHSKEILAELGISADEIETLALKGVIG